MFRKKTLRECMHVWMYVRTHVCMCNQAGCDTKSPRNTVEKSRNPFLKDEMNPKRV